MQAAAQKIAEQQEENTKLLEEKWIRFEHEYAANTIATEEELYAKKSEVWNAYGDESLQEHWSYFEDLCAYEKYYAEQSAKIAEENKIAAEKLAEDQKKQQEETLIQQPENQEKSLSDDESANFAKYLSEMSDAEFAKINELYNIKFLRQKLTCFGKCGTMVNTEERKQ